MRGRDGKEKVFREIRARAPVPVRASDLASAVGLAEGTVRRYLKLMMLDNLIVVVVDGGEEKFAFSDAPLSRKVSKVRSAIRRSAVHPRLWITEPWVDTLDTNYSIEREDGELVNIVSFCDEVGIRLELLISRLRRGLTVEQAIRIADRPLKKVGRKKLPPVVLTCALCGVEFERRASVEKRVASSRQSGPYCSVACSALGRAKHYAILHDEPRPPPLLKTLTTKTYCHHCIDECAAFLVKIGGIRHPLCCKCAWYFMDTGELPLDIGDETPFVFVSTSKRRKPLLHEIERRAGSRATLDKSTGMLTIMWVRP
jgi:hypothetical protein